MGFPDDMLSGQRIDLLGQLGLLVGCLPPMNDILFGKLVDHGSDFLKESLRLILLGRRRELFDQRARGLALVPVPDPLRFIRPDSFLCRFVIRHSFTKWTAKVIGNGEFAKNLSPPAFAGLSR